MPIRAVILDFGGVLVRFVDPHGQRKWEETLKMSEGELFAAVVESEASDHAMVGKISEDELWSHLGDSFKLDPQQLEELKQDFWRGQQVNTRLIQFIRDLDTSLKTAILSNAWSDARQTFVQIFGMDQLVDTIIISAEEGVAKPDPRIYELAAARLGITPQEAIFIDDLKENVEGAKAVDMQAVHFENNAQALAEIRSFLNTSTN